MSNQLTFTRREVGDTVLYAVRSANAGWIRALWVIAVLVVVVPNAYTTFATDPFDNELLLMLTQAVAFASAGICLLVIWWLRKRSPSRTWTIDRSAGKLHTQGSEIAFGSDTQVTVAGSPPVLSLGSTVLCTGTSDADRAALQQIADTLRTDIQAPTPRTNA